MKKLMPWVVFQFAFFYNNFDTLGHQHLITMRPDYFGGSSVERLSKPDVLKN
jgi:hypothetical protein